MQVIPHQKAFQFLFQPDWKKYNDTFPPDDENEPYFDIQVAIFKLCYNDLKKNYTWCAVCVYLGDGQEWDTFTRPTIEGLRIAMELEYYVDLKPIFNQLNISEDA